VWAQRQADLEDLAARRAEIVASLESMRAALHNTVALARDTSPTAGDDRPEDDNPALTSSAGAGAVVLPEGVATTADAPKATIPAVSDDAEPVRSVSVPAIESGDVRETAGFTSVGRTSAGRTTDNGLETDNGLVPAEADATSEWMAPTDVGGTNDVAEADAEDTAADTDADLTNVFRLVPPEVATDAASDLDTWAASWKLDKD
jgi:hypothetical protein